MNDSDASGFKHLFEQDQSVVPPAAVVKRAFVPTYRAYWDAADADLDAYWEEAAEDLVWIDRWDAIRRPRGNNHTDWFIGARCNITQNVLDRHADGANRNKTALFWVGESGEERRFTFGELLALVNRFAHVLRNNGVRRGDRVCIYMPLVPEAAAAMLACARLGAIHSVVYAGLGVGALRSRIDDAGASALIVSDIGYRRGKSIDLKRIADAAVDGSDVKTVIVHRRSSITVLRDDEVDLIPALAAAPDEFDPEPMQASDPLFILYTSGTTGAPKGVVFDHGGYAVGVARLCRIAFDLHPDDVYWSTSDIGWIVGHSCIVYGPWINGITQVMREGAPDFPTPGVVWQTVERFGVTALFTAPTTLRMFMRMGSKYPHSADLHTLKILICAGEPLNPEAQQWALDHIMQGRGPVCDNWWQTETGGPTLGTLPADVAKIGKVGRPMPGVRAAVVRPSGIAVEPGQGGLLTLRSTWPHMMRTIWNDESRYQKYFEEFPGAYAADDVATVDADGYITVLGRSDDVLNVAGHRIGTADVESALVAHPAVAEAAVVGIPDPLKGEAIHAFVILRAGFRTDGTLQQALVTQVRTELGPIATPGVIEVVSSLPKTRSGKIMRRVLKAQVMGVDPGDLSTLEE